MSVNSTKFKNYKGRILLSSITPLLQPKTSVVRLFYSVCWVWSPSFPSTFQKPPKPFWSSLFQNSESPNFLSISPFLIHSQCNITLTLVTWIKESLVRQDLKSVQNDNGTLTHQSRLVSNSNNLHPSSSYVLPFTTLIGKVPCGISKS